MAKHQNGKSNHPGIPFDPLQYVRRLESVGFTRTQAEAQAETLLAVVQEQLVTKKDLKEMESKLSFDIETVRNDLKREIKELDGKLTQQIKSLESKTSFEIKELESKTTLKIEVLKRDSKIWFGGMLATFVIVLSGISTLITHWNGH